MNLTLFAVPRGFEEPFIVEQENTLDSWIHLEPRPEILLFGDEPGIKETAEKFSCRYIPEVERSGSGRPIVDGVFHRAQGMATNDVLCYANMDIILMQDWMDALAQCAARFSQFLMIGQRWGLEIGGPLDFSGNWQARLRKRIERKRERVVLYRGCAADFFAFTRGVFPEFPPFIIGMEKWDHWVVSSAIGRGIPTIDVTPVTTVIHQGFSAKVSKTAEWHYNHELYRIWYEGNGGVGYTEEAPWILTKEGFRKR